MRLCLTSRKSLLETVSTGSGSDLVSDQHAIFLTILTPSFDHVATAPCTDCLQARFRLRQAPLCKCEDLPLHLLDRSCDPSDHFWNTLDPYQDLGSPISVF